MENTKSEVAVNIRDELGIQEFDTPKIVARQIVPTLEVGEKYSRIVRYLNKTTTGSGTIYTTPTQKIFYLTGVSVGYVCDAACDCTGITLDFTTNGATRYISWKIVPGVAQNMNQSVMFPFPIPIDQSTNIQQTGTHTAGTNTKNFTIYGFLK